MTSNERVKFCLKFLENPSFRVGFELTPEYRESSIIPITATTPLPTTIIGAMFSALLAAQGKKLKQIPISINNKRNEDIEIKIDNDGYVEEVNFQIYDKLQEEIFGCKGTVISEIYGPYWIRKQSGNEDIYFPMTIHYINDALFKLDNKKIEKDGEKIKVYVPKKYVMTSIALDHKTKIVRTGHTYTLERLPFKNWRLCIEFKIKNNKKQILEQIENRIVRIGTKGALAKIEITQDGLITPLQDAPEWIVISPLIITKKTDFDIVKAKVKVIPLGYSLLKQKKRPSLPVLATGSIIRNNKSSSIINKYGFGSLYPNE